MNIQRDLNLRQQTSPAMLALLTRSEGLHLLGYDIGLIEAKRSIPVDDATNQVGAAVRDGFTFDHISSSGKTIELRRLDGLRYPVSGYPEAYPVLSYEEDERYTVFDRKFPNVK